MSDSTLAWIWSEYTISPDPASGMQSLYQTCSALSKHILLPSHIVLSGGGFTLLPELAEILTDVVCPLGQLLDLAMRDSGLAGIQHFCHTELRVLTCTTGLDIATQNQVIWNWIHLADNMHMAMVDLESLCHGRPIHVLGRERPSHMRRIIMSLHWSLLVKLPAELLRSHCILVPPPAANTREVERQRIQHLEHRARMLADVSHISRGILASSPAVEVQDTTRRELEPCECGFLHPSTHEYSAPSSRIGLTSQVLATLKPPVTVVRLASALTPVNGWMHHTTAVHVPSPASPSCTESTASAILCAADSSIDDLILAYTQASVSGWSLSSQTARIVKKKSLDSSDITDRSNDSSLPYFGQFGLERHLFLSTENATLEMQRLLTAAFTFVEGRPICFVVDPHDVLMGILRGASCIHELQVAWKGLRERMRIAQLMLLEYHADCVAPKTSLAALDEGYAGKPSVPTCESIVRVGPKDKGESELGTAEDLEERVGYTARL
ncbi:hypothetical protein K438DRAFT_1993912 [Mycena galopus ATCC 62051]|nr:hypothetical protein K438DRAFT_1993912 [Mycena galopus ATCC 62051]